MQQFNLKLLSLFVFIVISIAVVSLTFAQSPTLSPEGEAKKYNITFPIAELSNCTSVSECRTYCEDPVNTTACVDFAKQKGFYKEDRLKTAQSEVIKQAQAELGCNSPESCREVCEQEANFEKCHLFAQKMQLNGGQVQDPRKAEVLGKAKEVLGCTSYESCKSFCVDPANEQKCSEFAKTAGLRGGEERRGPGGCTSAETCRQFCTDPANFQVCTQFNTVKGTSFTGPGGCNSAESCKTYCEEHIEECSQVKGASKQEMCVRTPSCTWANDNCECRSFAGAQTEGDYQQFCEENEDKCENGKPEVKPDEYCRRYPDRCKGGVDPKEYCIRNPVCSWSDDSKTCQCQLHGFSSSGASTIQRTEGDEEIKNACKEGPNKCREEVCKKFPERCGELTGAPAFVSPFPSGTDAQKFVPGSAPPSNPPPGSVPTGGFIPPGLSTEEMCRKNPNCTWSNNLCQCQPGSAANKDLQFARPSGQQFAPDSSFGSPPPSGPPDGQRQDSGGFDPAKECTLRPNCTWNGSSCQCSGASYTNPFNNSGPGSFTSGPSGGDNSGPDGGPESNEDSLDVDVQGVRFEQPWWLQVIQLLF